MDPLGTAHHEDTSIHSERTRLLVVDDDPTFGKILHQIGLQSGVDVVVVNKVEAVNSLPKEHFDVAVLDFDLGPVNGVEVAIHLEKSGCTKDCILVSQSQEVSTPIGNWPKSIKGFVQKSLGHFAIFEIALAAVESSATSSSLQPGGL